MRLRSLIHIPTWLAFAVLSLAGCSQQAPEPLSEDASPAKPSENTRANSDSSSVANRAIGDAGNGSKSSQMPGNANSARVETPFSQFVKLWSVDTDEFDYTTGFSLAPDGKTFAVASSALQFWKIGVPERQGEIEDFQDVAGFDGEVTVVQYSPDGQRLALGVDSGTLHTWNLTAGKFELAIDAHPDGLKSVAFSSDGKHIATSGFEDKVKTWSVADGQPGTSYPVQDSSIVCVTYSPDGRQLAACGDKVTVWNLSDGKVVHEFTNEFEVRNACATFAPDSQSLAIGEMAATVTVLDLKSGKPVVTCSGAEGPIDEIVYSNDGKRLVTRVGDYTVRIWDSATGSQLQRLDFADDENTETLAGIAWAAAPGLLLTASETGEVTAWGPDGTAIAGVAATNAKPALDESTADSTTEARGGSTPSTGEAKLSPEESAANRVPAHVVEATDLLDLREIEWPPGIDGANNNPVSLYYHDIGSAAEATKFYDEWFKAQGWTDVTAETNYGNGRAFERNGFRIDCTAMTVSPGCSISMRHIGNYDTRWLPQPDDAEVISSGFHFSLATSAKDRNELRTFLNDAFHEDGWHSIEDRTHENDIYLSFVQNGIKSSVRITDDGKNSDKSMLQYSIDMLQNEVPIPDDATELKLTESRGTSFSLKTSQDLSSVVNFYNATMPLSHWEPGHNPSEVTETSTILRFVRGRDTAEVSIRKADSGATSVVGMTTANPSDKYIAAAKRAAERSRERDNQRYADDQEAVQDAMPVADFPLPESAEKVFRNPHGSGGDIRFETKEDVAAHLKFFREVMTKKQWKEDTHETHDRQTYGQLVFRKRKAEIRISISSMHDPTSGYSGMVQGNGLLAKNDTRLKKKAESQSGRPEVDGDAIDTQIKGLEEMLKQFSLLPGLEDTPPPPTYEQWLKKNELESSGENAAKYTEVVTELLQEAVMSAGTP